VLVNVGKEQHICEGQVVTNEDGMIGRTVGVNNKTSRVLLITDPRSRLPVMGVKSGQKAIASGNGSNFLDLIYTKDNNSFIEDEVVMTSGDGEMIPYGIIIGIIKKLSNTTYIVKPFVNINEVEYVAIIDNT
jgi:rod shape-determining protein MreC